jgi:hypothetical protein
MVLVDTDDDGVNDLTAIAIGTSILVHPTRLTGRDERTLNNDTAVAAASDAIRHLPRGTDQLVPSIRDRHSVLASLCLLRC